MAINLQKNQLLEAEITAYSAEGMGIARANGAVIFVRGGARGDICLLRVVKVLKNRAYAIIERILTPSPHRVSPPCPAFPQCGGCDFQHLAYGEELELKATRVRDAMERIGGFNPGEVAIEPSPEEWSYRNKAQFPVCRGEGSVTFGLYRSHSHQVVAVNRCMIQDERASRLAAAVCRWADKNCVPVYNEETGEGALRHIYVRTSGLGSQLCLVSAADNLPDISGLVAEVREAGPDIRGIMLNLNPRPTNRVLGEKIIVLWGESTLPTELLGKSFGLSPLSFFQVNHGQCENLYRGILALCGEKRGLALDLYCGIGTISLALADLFEQVIGVEVVPQAICDARASAGENGVANCRFICGDAADAAARLARENLRPDVVVCDPPRKGMSPAALKSVVEMSPSRIIYVACDPASLARDGALLREEGYSLLSLKAYDMFPKTANIEALAMFRR